MRYGKPKYMREIFNDDGTHYGFEEVTDHAAHGFWMARKENDLATYKCSACYLRTENATPFCPRCGAKMDEVVKIWTECGE